MINTYKNEIPDFQTIMLPLLEYFSDGKEHSTSEIVGHISDKFNLTEEQREQLLPSGTQTTIYNRVIWAKTYMNKAGLLESPRRSINKITKRGREVLNENLEKIDIKYLEKFPEFIEFRNKKETEPTDDGDQLIKNKTPEELIKIGYKVIEDTLKSDVLESIMNCSSDFFEKLVVDLLIKMGYGGSLEDAGKAIGKSGDEGIDGIIKEDKLGLDFIYIQAKRWKGPVGSPEIHKFVGALTGKQASKGVFITTSRFTNDARDFVTHLGTKVVLIDADELAKLMIENDIGVTRAETYSIKKIDTNYFIEE
jgi:restriction system protein